MTESTVRSNGYAKLLVGVAALALAFFMGRFAFNPSVLETVDKHHGEALAKIDARLAGLEADHERFQIEYGEKLIEFTMRIDAAEKLASFISQEHSDSHERWREELAKIRERLERIGRPP